MAQAIAAACSDGFIGRGLNRVDNLRSTRLAISAFPDMAVGSGLHIVLFEACSAFTRVAACTLALSPIRDTLIEGFSHFVTSMTAPIASGWSDCRVGFAPTGKRRLCTAHAKSRHRADRSTLLPRAGNERETKLDEQSSPKDFTCYTGAPCAGDQGY